MSPTETESPKPLTLREKRQIMGIRLRALRLDLGLTQGQVALRLDVPRSTISGMEQGRTTANVFRLRLLCQLYHAPMDFLFTGRGLDRVLNSKWGTLAQRTTTEF